MALTTREKDFSARYNELVEQAQLAQTSAVRGCMVIKPYGFAIRENMQKYLDAMFKATWHQNAYFPLFIPKSFFTKEAKHVEGFATEAAVVTHYRLKKDPKTGKMEVDPEAKLEEELIVRPTSETIIWNTYKDRIQSYRDLPILVNQRANVVRWEMRTRLFLRTAEFLWQEWHTAHATAEEAKEETKKMRDVYQDFFTNFLAISGVPGEKSENERFAGAENTYTIECMMQDGKALQACTSHFLWQNFGKAFDVTFVNKDNTPEYARATSRWASTRMMGGLIMSHSDDKGLVLPPAIAPYHVVIVPIWKNDEEKALVKNYISQITAQFLPEAIWWLDLVSLKDYDIDSINFYFEKSDTYNITKDELAAIWVTDNVCKVNKQVGTQLKKVNNELQKQGYKLYVKDAYRSQALYDLVYKKRIALHGKENVDKIFKPIRAIHATGNAVDVSMIDMKTWQEVAFRNDFDSAGNKKSHDEIISSFKTFAYENSNNINEKQFHIMRTILRRAMNKYGFIGLLHEYRHFELSNTIGILSSYVQNQLPISYQIDRDDQKSPGWKYNQYELQWVPIRIAVGPKDVASSEVEVFRRDTSTKEKVAIADIWLYVSWTLQDMQSSLLAKTQTMRESNTVSVDTYDDFKKALDENKFVMAHRDGTPETEEIIKQETKATIRCIPADAKEEAGTCIKTGKASTKRVLFAIAY
jgi:prolyl-tRNA synthetase